MPLDYFFQSSLPRENCDPSEKGILNPSPTAAIAVMWFFWNSAWSAIKTMATQTASYEETHLQMYLLMWFVI